MHFPEAVKRLRYWDAKNETCKEKSSATLTLACPSSFSLGLCNVRAPMSQLGQGASEGTPACWGQEMGPVKPVAAPSSSSSPE